MSKISFDVDLAGFQCKLVYKQKKNTFQLKKQFTINFCVKKELTIDFCLKIHVGCQKQISKLIFLLSKQNHLKIKHCYKTKKNLGKQNISRVLTF